jgi:hypothetical protein
MKKFRNIFSISAVPFFALQLAIASAQAHAINTKGTGGNNGKGKTDEASRADPATEPSGKFKWVARTSYNECPNGSVKYVAEDGGAKCAVELK